MIYLASPYSHVDDRVRESRYKAACQATANLLRYGLLVFSPVVYSHPLVEYGLGGDWEFWREYDIEHLKRCDRMIVLTIAGWKSSRGVQAELEFARQIGMDYRMMSPTTIALMGIIRDPFGAA